MLQLVFSFFNPHLHMINLCNIGEIPLAIISSIKLNMHQFLTFLVEEHKVNYVCIPMIIFVCWMVLIIISKFCCSVLKTTNHNLNLLGEINDILLDFQETPWMKCLGRWFPSITDYTLWARWWNFKKRLKFWNNIRWAQG
jgi:hypothetical protein